MKKLLLGATLLTTAAISNAQDAELNRQGWFVGGAIGTLDLSFTPERESESSFDESTNVYTAFGGYNFTEWFGIEFDVTASAEFTDKNSGLDSDIFGTSFSPKFTYHINDVIGLYFKAGLQFVGYSQTVNTSYFTHTKTWGGIAPLMGMGVQFSTPVGVATRLDYRYSNIDMDRTDDLGYSNLDNMKLTHKILNLSVHYQF